MPGLLAAFALLLAGLTSGCFLTPRPQPASGSSFSTSSGALGQLTSSGPGYCTIRPQLYSSWKDPMQPPPSCPYEGWLRQIIRDSGELEPCISEKELRFLLTIGDQGRVDDMQVLNSPPQVNQQCATRVVRSWEFASGKKAGTIQVVLERRSSEGQGGEGD